ncbi:MAG: transporter [Gemmatimonadetes bacterium]|nr:transporter [Gemmatimonadota bacterium]
MGTPRTLALPPQLTVLLAIVSVQGGAAMAKGLFSVLGPMGAAGIRTALSAVMLLAVFRPSLRTFTREQWMAVVPYGVILGAMNIVFYLAIARIPLGLAVTLEFLGPLLLAAAGSKRALDLVWVAMAGAGVWLLAPWSGGGLDPIGIGYALLAGAGWAAYIVIGGRVSRLLSAGEGVAVGMVVAGLVVLPFSFGQTTPLHFSLGLAGACMVLALLSSALPFTLEMLALRALPARTFSILMSLEPAVAAVCGGLFLREYLSPTQWLASGLVVAASAGVSVTARVVPVHVEV